MTLNTQYTFEIRAVNASGDGAAGSVSARPVSGVPNKPTLTVSVVDEDGKEIDGKATLTWTKNNTPPRGVDKWQYRYKTTGAYGAWTDVPDSGDSTTSYELEPLNAGYIHLPGSRRQRGWRRRGVQRRNQATVTPHHQAHAGAVRLDGGRRQRAGYAALEGLRPRARHHGLRVPLQEDRRRLALRLRPTAGPTCRTTTRPQRP